MLLRQRCGAETSATFISGKPYAEGRGSDWASSRLQMRHETLKVHITQNGGKVGCLKWWCSSLLHVLWLQSRSLFGVTYWRGISIPESLLHILSHFHSSSIFVHSFWCDGRHYRQRPERWSWLGCTKPRWFRYFLYHFGYSIRACCSLWPLRSLAQPK